MYVCFYLAYFFFDIVDILFVQVETLKNIHSKKIRKLHKCMYFLVENAQGEFSWCWVVIIVQCENNLGFHNLDVKNRQGASYPIIGCIIGGTIRNSLVLVAGALFT